MQSIESSHILAVGASFASEARAVCSIFHWQVVTGNNFITQHVGHRNFCGWNGVKIVDGHVVHLTFFVGQLTGAIGRGFIHEKGRNHFGVARFSVLVQKPLDQGTLQTRALASVYGKSSAGNFNTSFKINETIYFSEVPVGLVGCQLRFCTPGADCDIV